VSKFFINRPIVAMVISILMVIVGAVTIATLPVAQFPNIVPPEVQVLATYVGADAQTIEQSVATPVEQQMSGVDNMNYMYSLNSTADGLMRLIVDYDVKTDPNTDLMLTQMRQTQAASQLPADVTNYGVTVQKTVTAPLMLVTLYSPNGTCDAGSKVLPSRIYSADRRARGVLALRSLSRSLRGLDSAQECVWPRPNSRRPRCFTNNRFREPFGASPMPWSRIARRGNSARSKSSSSSPQRTRRVFPTCATRAAPPAIWKS
jgi:hypothetical protein